MTAPSSRTPVRIPTVTVTQQRPTQIAVSGFVFLLVSAIGSWVKEAGLSGVSKVLVDLASRGWWVGATLISFAVAWIIWGYLQALAAQTEEARRKAEEFREHAMTTDTRLGDAIERLATTVSEMSAATTVKVKLLQHQSETLEALSVQIDAMPEAVAKAIAEVTQPGNKRLTERG